MNHAFHGIGFEAGSGGFVTTHWSNVAAAGETTSSQQSTAALEQLCRTYWYPLYAYVRRQGNGPEDAQDLVQEFFCRFLQQGRLRQADPGRGRFRTFLLTSMKNFLINEWQKGTRAKRSNGHGLLSWDEISAEDRFAAEPATEQPPDALYDRGWAGVLLERTVAALEAELERAGKRDVFERLKGFVWGEQSGQTYREMGEQLGMSEGAVKVAVHRLRQRFGELLRGEISQTVATPMEVEEELRYLVSSIRHRSQENV